MSSTYNNQSAFEESNFEHPRVPRASANINTPHSSYRQTILSEPEMFAMSPSDDLEHLSTVDDENNSMYDDGYGMSPEGERIESGVGHAMDVDAPRTPNVTARRSDSDYSSITTDTTDSPASFIGSQCFCWGDVNR